jgi:hypothetical protein
MFQDLIFSLCFFVNMSKRQRTGVNSYWAPAYGGYAPNSAYQLYSPVRGASLEISGSGVVGGDMDVVGTIDSSNGTNPDIFGALSCSSLTDTGACSLMAGLNVTGSAQFIGGSPSIKVDTMQVTGTATIASMSIGSISAGALSCTSLTDTGTLSCLGGTASSWHVTGTSALDGSVTAGALTCSSLTDTGTLSCLSATASSLHVTGTTALDGSVSAGAFTPSSLHVTGTSALDGTITTNSIVGNTDLRLGAPSASNLFLSHDVAVGTAIVGAGNTATTFAVEDNTFSYFTVSSASGVAVAGDTDTKTLSLGTGASARAINVGNSSGVTTTNVAGVFNVGTAAATSTISLGTAGARAVNIGNTTSPSTSSIVGTINAGTVGSQTITIGNTTGPTTTNMLGSMNINNVAQAETINIGAGGGPTTVSCEGNYTFLERGPAASTVFSVAHNGPAYVVTKTINLGNSTVSHPSTMNLDGVINTLSSATTSMLGTVSIGTDTALSTLSIGTGGARNINIGNTTGPSTTAMVGTMLINATNAATTTIAGGSFPNNGTLNLGVGFSEAVNIGIATAGTNAGASLFLNGTVGVNSNSSQDTCSIGNTTGPSATAIYGLINMGTLSDTSTISLGTAGARAINIGNSAGASTVGMSGTVNIGTDTGTQTVSIGTGASIRQINIGNSGGGSTILNVHGQQSYGTESSAQTIAIGTAGARAINIGNANATTAILSSSVSTGTLKVSTGAVSGYQLVSDGSGNATWKNQAVSYSQSAGLAHNFAANSNTMYGLGLTKTSQWGGAFVVTMTAYLLNTGGAANLVTSQLSFGTGTPPAAGDPTTGTGFSQTTDVSVPASSLATQFTQCGSFSTTASTTYWIDFDVNVSNAGGPNQVGGINVLLWEA